MGAPSSPARLPLRVPRWQPYDRTIVIEGCDLSGATLSLQARLYRDQPGAPQITLANADPPAQGLSVTASVVDLIPVSVIRIIIDEATTEGVLPFPDSGVEPGQDVTLKHEIVISRADLVKARWFADDLIIEAGANQA